MIEGLISDLTILHTMGIKPNYSAIARKYNLDYRTVKNTFATIGKPLEVHSKKKRVSFLEEHRKIIIERLSIPGVTIKSLHFYLTNEKIVDCKYETLKKYIQRTNVWNEVDREEKVDAKKAHVRYETDPGLQAQMDWVESLQAITVDGEVLYYNVFSMTLGYSRTHYYEYTEGKTEIDMRRCLINGFKTIGGMTKYVLTDNMTAIVSITNEGGKKHNSIIQFEKDLGIKIKLCKPRTPETKGKVESSNKFIQWIKAYDGKIKDKDDLKQKIRDIMNAVNRQANQETKIAPFVAFQKEKQYLRPLPNTDLLNHYQHAMNSSKVPATLLIYFEGSKYSVPINYINKTVHYCKQGNELYIYYNNDLIAKHKLSKNLINYDKDHYRAALIDKFNNLEDLDRVVEENLKKFKNME